MKADFQRCTANSEVELVLRMTKVENTLVDSLDKDLIQRIWEIIGKLPAYVKRRIHAVVCNWDSLKVNPKKVQGLSTLAAGKRMKKLVV